MTIKKVKENVALLLKENPELRNDDRLLIFAYWNTFDDAKLKMPEHPITSCESIRRIRAKWQSEGFFLPTNPDVIKKRRKQRYKIEDALGYA